MKKLICILIVLVVIAGGAWLAWRGLRPASASAGTAPTTAKVERGSVRLAVASTGRVVSNLDVEIKCRASGEVRRLPKDVSDPVKAGDLLFELDPTDMQRNVDRAKAALAEAGARAKYARVKASRLKQTLDQDLSSRDEYEAADAAALQAEAQAESVRIALADAEQQLGYTRVVSPIDGVVSARNIQIGQIIASGINNVGGGTSALTISDLSRIFVVASVDESDIGRVAGGQRVTVTADAFPGRRFAGRVVQIATKGASASNVVTFDVKIEVLDPQEPSAPAEAPARRDPGRDAGEARSGPGPAAGRDRGGSFGGESSKSLLKPEMTANVEIVAVEKDDVLLVPAEAVSRQRGKRNVQVIASPGAAPQEREVEVGINDGTKVEVLRGLSEGETVVLNKAADSKWTGGQGSRQGGPPPPMFMGGGRR